MRRTGEEEKKNCVMSYPKCVNVKCELLIRVKILFAKTRRGGNEKKKKRRR
jgi:hypothetical protein